MQTSRRTIQMLGVLMILVSTPGHTMDEKIADVWQRIQMACAAKVEKPDGMQPPATAGQIAQLEKVIGYEVPGPLRESLLVYNGSVDWGLEIVQQKDSEQRYRALSIDKIIKHWQRDRQRETEAKAEGDPFAKKPQWIPIFDQAHSIDEQIYLDTTDGTVLQFNLAASWGDEVDDFRYPDLVTFLKVLEHHIKSDLWFEWGNGTDAKAVMPPLHLDEAGIKKLKSETKQTVSIKLSDGKVFTVASEKESQLVDSILEALLPAKFIRTPAVEAPDYEVGFKVADTEYKIGIKKGPLEMLSYSINTANSQITGGDPGKLQKIMDSIVPR